MIQLHNQFRVDLPIDESWKLLTDLPQVAQCLPGAHLDDVVEGEYRGGLSTRIGPISAKYQGTASFREFDEISHRAVIEARGREEKGSGSASALITAVLKPDGTGTLVDVSTELAISGRAAQFGRSLLAEVSSTMIDEFVRRLEVMIAGEPDQPIGQAGERSISQGEATGTRTITSPVAEADQLDVLTTIVLPMLRKFTVPIGVALLSGIVGIVVGRHGRNSGRGARFAYAPPYAAPGDYRALSR